MIHIVLSHCTPLSPSAVAFKNAKQFDQAKEAYLKEAEYHTENKAYPFLYLFFQHTLLDYLTSIPQVIVRE